MKFEEILNDHLFSLPKAISKNKTYRKLIEELFDNYLKLFENVDERSIRVDGLKNILSISTIINKQKKFIDGLTKTLDIYFDGQPARAYEIFAKTMGDRIKSFSTLQTLKEFESGESFYRIRAKEENYPLSFGNVSYPFSFKR